MKNEFDIPLTDTMRTDIQAAIMELMALQERGTLKSYGLDSGVTAGTAIFAIRCRVSNLMDENEELEAELS